MVSHVIRNLRSRNFCQNYFKEENDHQKNELKRRSSPSSLLLKISQRRSSSFFLCITGSTFKEISVYLRYLITIIYCNVKECLNNIEMSQCLPIGEHHLVLKDYYFHFWINFARRIDLVSDETEFSIDLSVNIFSR